MINKELTRLIELGVDKKASEGAEGSVYKKVNFEILQDLTLSWAEKRGLLKPENTKTQTLKLMEEVGELASSIVKGNIENAKDDIGDILVVVTILCEQLGLDPVDCFAFAYNEIKDRKGKLVDGSFVKEV